MERYNWLSNYKNRSGIQRSFEGISHRALYMSESDTAYHLFNEHYESLRECYASFFPSLKEFAFNKLKMSTQ
jgi:acyl carrier protein phosphodiesterase